MATGETSVPLNGNFAQHQGQGYDAAEHNYNAHGMNSTSSAPYTSAAATTSTPASSGNGANEIPKDEVGWYFVEQYYTTLSRSPEKLYLFYNKRSQFVSGIEEEKVSVCIGQKAINDRIKEQNFHDCKVRVTNVDSQGSDQNIVIQVIGEISNKEAPSRKFVQTFVLAEQTNGYFVLNDIFRYILEDDELEVANEPEPVPTGGPTGVIEPVHSVAEPEVKAAEDTAEHTVQGEDAAAKVDKELEAIAQPMVEAGDAPAAEVNGASTASATESVQAEETPAVPVAVPEKITKPEVAAPPQTEETAQQDKAKEPEPVRAVTPKASPAPPPVPAAAPKAAAPKTWASLAASANKVATPNVTVAAPTSAAPTQTKPAAPSQQPAANAPATPATPNPARDPSPANSQGDAGSGWQTAGADHSKRQSRTQIQPTQDNPSTRAYIKNVYESVDGGALKSALAKFGEIAYFDISRQKNCAFVDFATHEGFQAAVAANPHRIGDDIINVEERRLRPGQYQYVPRGGVRGGRGRAEGGQAGQGRGGFKQDGGRGAFGRGRGGSFTPRGRGGN